MSWFWAISVAPCAPHARSAMTRVSLPSPVMESVAIDIGELMTSLQDYEQISASERGHASFNAGQGAHDDLVMALGLSVGTEPHAARAHSASCLRKEPAVEDWFEYRQRVRRLRERRGAAASLGKTVQGEIVECPGEGLAVACSPSESLAPGVVPAARQGRSPQFGRFTSGEVACTRP
jgi:hypothetical protein